MILKKLFGKKEKIVKPDQYPIVCPYCFNKFDANDVEFRVTVAQEGDEEYSLKEDEKLSKYLAKFNQDSAMEMEPVISPSQIPPENHIFSGKVLVGLIDRYGNETRKRVCPSCHNDLPQTAGKYPSNIISIIGTSTSGKSVYIASLIHTIQQTTARNFNGACIALTNNINRKFREDYEEPIFERGQMLLSTQKEVVQEPMIFQFEFKDGETPPITLVFFDVAGEGMTDAQFLDIRAGYIRNSSGMLFMVDPLQIRTIRQRLLLKINDEEQDIAEKKDNPEDIVISLYENFIGYEDSNSTTIPTAIILTKSDMLSNLVDDEGTYLKQNSNIFRNYIHSEYFNLSEYENISGEVEMLIDQVDVPFKNALEVRFKNLGYFAVSSLGTNPKNQQIIDVVTPIRVDEPFLWMLYKLGYVEGRRQN